MKRHHHRIIAYISTGAIIAALAVNYINKRYEPAKDFESLPNHTPIQQAQNPKNNPTLNPIPSTLLLKVPFTPQAPTANWDELHNEACEEASAIMADFYFNGDTRATLPPAEVETEISKITQWEDNHLGYHLDINSEEVAQMISGVYGLQTKILTDYNEQTIKSELLQNHLVLLPTNGKLLGNPNFRSPGPPYHMLVIKGYSGSTIITNDPGTRKGLNYPYSYNVLYNANGEFDHTTHSVDTKRKNIIVVWK